MDLFPAIDIRGGGAVRLTQGDFAREHAYGDPVALASRFIAGGSRWLHVVDLDAARRGVPVNRPTVLAIAAVAAAAGVSVQTGGGVRSEADVEELLGGGVSRVVFGTAALEDPPLVRAAAERHPGGVAVGIDYRTTAEGTTEVAVRGWEQGGGATVADALSTFDGVDIAAVIVTAIERDGMLTGPDLEGLALVLAATSLPVIASGGVGSVADIAALAELTVSVGPGTEQVRSLAGVITGKALVDGRLTVEEGMAACRPSG
jgi:phosphoribosylformimino-5-aminoimidazole carboxamide ribotide isomerase